MPKLEASYMYITFLLDWSSDSVREINDVEQRTETYLQGTCFAMNWDFFSWKWRNQKKIFGVKTNLMNSKVQYESYYRKELY